MKTFSAEIELSGNETMTVEATNSRMAIKLVHMCLKKRGIKLDNIDMVLVREM
jgi:3-oxoacyl-[acyl-carrier-protein] synthase III